MARKGKSVYERIEDKREEILKAENMLVQLNNELQELNLEKDDLEMRQLLETVKSNGLNINKALELLSCSNSQDNDQDSQKKRVKKEKKEELTLAEI